MRRDVFIENDSGGFSILAADAVDAIIDDARDDDMRFVREHKAMLLLLYGDDSMPVRVVVDEPLRPDEEAQWLARVTWRIDTTDGRMLVMGGFDPDVLQWWKDDHGGQGDGRGVAEFQAAPGSWRVDLYTHAGSMNGRVMLSEGGEPPGAWFRREHPDAPFPLWLAKMLDFSGEEDPGFETLWRDVRASVAQGALQVDTEGGDAIGFLVHVTPLRSDVGDPPDGGWFDHTDGARTLESFPLGIASLAPDPELRDFRDRILGIVHPEPERPIAGRVVEVIEVWPGDALKKIEGGPVPIATGELYLLHWMAALTADSPPRFELWVEPRGDWTPPVSTPDFAVVAKGKSLVTIGPVENTGGWHVWWTSRDVAKALGPIPDESTITLASAPIRDADDDEGNPQVGLALYEGVVRGGTVQLTEASPRVSHDTLAEAIAFTRDLALHGRIHVRTGAERDAFDAEAAVFSPEEGSLVWDGDVVALAEPDDRTALILGGVVFRKRYADQWPMDVEEDDDE